MAEPVIKGAGLGLRRSLLGDVVESPRGSIDFFELAPENWIGVGGRMGRQLRQVAEHTPIICHGLSLSIGSTQPLQKNLVLDIKNFLDTFSVPIYSEHLSYTSDDGQLYDLLPLPFTDEAVKHIASRIRQVQEMLERRMAIENISYYLVPEQSMSEVEFINAVLEEADCDLLLDVNNVYVNSQNHGYDPLDFLKAINVERVSYLHMAGHFVEDDGLIIDTHGADVIGPVWALLDETYGIVGNIPTLLERDFNLPALTELDVELEHIRKKQSECQQTKADAKSTSQTAA
jgi:uncharacterized protein (UPF0276 family)